jgi:SPX domain protein involved in polyphosphate accumulation
LRALEAADATGAAGDGFEAEVRATGDAFLDVERYVNVNVTAVRKVLKKHDKVLPQRPIKAFYMARMHDMRWVRNDYSDVVVRLSRLYAARAARAAAPTEAVDEQSFVRATTKYWVRNEDLSAVKLAISEHLPVLLQGGKHHGGAAKDSQLVNSVYLDSPSLELYHGRLAKTPGAVALRLRWHLFAGVRRRGTTRDEKKLRGTL